MYKNKYVNALVNFIKENKTNFRSILLKKPYSLRTVKNCPFNNSWYIFVYELSSSDLANDIVRACRGIVLSIDDNGIKPISVPYTKFFNYGEIVGKDIEEQINWSKAKISMKMDGILLKTACVEENGEKRLYFFTNGSFVLNASIIESAVSDEEETKGMKTFGDLLSYCLKKVDDTIKIFFDNKIGSFYITEGWSDKIPIGSTLMFELVSPRYKIICQYNETKLYLHGYRDPDLIEHDPRELNFGLKFEYPEIFNASNYEDVKKIVAEFDGKEKEGCVVVDYTSPETPRVKIKAESYLNLKFINDITSNNQLLFKTVVFNEYDDLKITSPSVEKAINEIKENIDKFKQWFNSERKKYSEICHGKDPKENKKTWALWCKGKFSKDILQFYLIMDDNESNSLDRLDKKLKHLGEKKGGYEMLQKLIPKN